MGNLTQQERCAGKFSRLVIGLATLIGMHGAAAEALAPVVDSFTVAPAAVSPGDAAVFAVEAHDPDCSTTCTSGCGLYIRADLTEWQASGGGFDVIDRGVSGSPYASSATWRAPQAEGTYTVTVSLSDSGSSFCGGGRQTTTAELQIVVSETVDLPPQIVSVTADPTVLFPGGVSDLRCEAVDPEGLGVAYEWSTTDGLLTPSSSAATFTAADPGVATVTCTARDPGGAAASRTVALTVSDVRPLSTMRSELAAPQRLAVDSMGDVFVVDRGAGGIVVMNVFSGTVLYRLPLADAASVAVDWNDHLLVGSGGRALVVGRDGETLLELDPGTVYGAVADVAVDHDGRRYGVLYGSSARVVVFDEAGDVVAAFGSTGDDPDQARGARGLAATPAGNWAVADGVHGLVKVFTPAGALVRAFGGLGGGVGEFVQLDDVEVAPDGVVFASDAFQSRVQSFNPDGSPREVLGTYGDGPGRFKTPTGISVADRFGRIVVASLNTPALEVFARSDVAVAVPAPVAAVSPETVVFGSQRVGVASPPRAVTLANTGDAPFGIRSLSVTDEFASSSDCPLFLDPGGSCTVEVTFAPLAPGLRAGVLEIATSAAAGVLRVELLGTGFVPAGIAFSPAALAFPDQDVFTASAPRPVTMTNTGTVPLAVGSIAATGEFDQVNGCGTSLAPGASCTVLVTFAPVTIGDHILGSLQVESSATVGAATVALDGRGVGLELTAAPAAVDFGVVAVGEESAPRTVTVQNTGSDFVHVADVALAGSAAASYRVVDDACSGILLMRDQACLVTVAYAPTAAGDGAALLTVASDALGSPDIVELAGASSLEAGEAIPVLSRAGLLLLAGLLAVVALGVLKRGGGV